MGKPLPEPDDFADCLRESVADLGLTLEAVQQQHGIALFRNVLGRERMTREKLDRLLAALPFEPGKKAEIARRYEGQGRESLRAVVVAGVRRHTQEGLAEQADIGMSAITYILHGDPRRREGSEAREVTWATWTAIAKVMELPDLKTLELWRKHMKTVFEAENDATPLGTEMELLLARRPEMSANKLRAQRPAPFDQMSVRAFQAFLRELRAGTPHPWPQMQALLDAFKAEPFEATGFALEWMKVVRDERMPDQQEILQLDAGKAAYFGARLALIKQLAAARGPSTVAPKSRAAAAEADVDFSDDDDSEEENADRAVEDADEEPMGEEEWSEYERLGRRGDY
jgi:hypothetical protein